MVGILNIGEVNGLDTEQFVWMFGNVVESYKDAATSVAEKKPFRNVEHLAKLFSEHLENLSREEKLKVLCLHPDLAGRLADEGNLTAESTKEQKSAELNNLDPKVKAKINRLNSFYREKFGFPFVICARENKANVITEQLEKRYRNTVDQEIIIGINEVKKICKLRILDIVWEF